MPKASVDIGSNSVLLLVVDDAGRRLHDEARVVGLGKGLGDRGLFQPERMDAAEAALADYVATATGLGVEPWSIKAVATSAARRAMNAETFFAKLKRTLGLRVRIITGEEEARLTWLGAQVDLPHTHTPEPRIVVDLGGGSTEVVVGQAGEVRQRTSLEFGTVRLTERFLTEDAEGRVLPESVPPLTEYLDVEIRRIPFALPADCQVVGVAGTVTTLAAMRRGLETYEGDLVHGMALSKHDLQDFIDRLAKATRAERQVMAAISPKRADLLFAGATVLHRLLVNLRADHLLVSDRGLRYGVLAA
ncbi:MAG: Ppx/GppA phosphatase family protein [Myxococcota bacterium]